MANLEELTSLLWGCEITSYKFNLEDHSISLEIKRVFNNETTVFDVKLNEVCSFSWVNGMGDDRKKSYDWEYLDLVSFDTINDTKIHIMGDSFLNQYSQAPNICLEIGNSVLLVEAKYLSINNERFELLDN
ncbi:YxiG family protein [Paenibacillus ihbetae]|uniref:Uncharacterized protein n=1 Tax=Paenibacillus ihbetae TaxID=1870820 RepID=A0ABX3JPE5_9BACL|nr:hypothetical protein [Paenibacillus ihbetae]OOC58721.1 hypothetical protein BBD40_23865 [Paenibacillus ihbetae]